MRRPPVARRDVAEAALDLEPSKSSTAPGAGATRRAPPPYPTPDEIAAEFGHLSRAGVPLIVIQPFREKPALPRYRASSRHDAAKAQIECVADCNLGIQLGALAAGGRRLFAMEFDDAEAHEAIESIWYDLPPTWCVQGPGERLTRIYACSERATINPDVARLAPGVVIRDEGDVICVPPSRTRLGHVTWALGASPDARPVADAPAWLLSQQSDLADPVQCPQRLKFAQAQQHARAELMSLTRRAELSKDEKAINQINKDAGVLVHRYGLDAHLISAIIFQITERNLQDIHDAVCESWTEAEEREYAENSNG